MEICPACGGELDFKPWDNELSSLEICPHCKIQFGYDDELGGATEKKPKLYRLWNEAWLANKKQPLSKEQIRVVIAKAMV
jgi:ssDNA-binding Zn-finger/Zn-ribbon topoisomerase 1